MTAPYEPPSPVPSGDTHPKPVKPPVPCGVFTPAIQEQLDAAKAAFQAEHPDVPVIQTIPLNGPATDDL